MTVLIGLNIWLICYVVEKNHLRAGIFAEENYSLLDLCVSKPWCKIQSCCIGVAMAWLYFNIVQYRKKSEFEQKSMKNPDFSRGVLEQ